MVSKKQVMQNRHLSPQGIVSRENPRRDPKLSNCVTVLRPPCKSDLDAQFLIWAGKVEDFLDQLPSKAIFDLVITSPPYNLGKPYEEKLGMDEYKSWQKSVIDKIIPRVKETGSICWQVGNFVENGEIFPLDIELAQIFRSLGMQLRNRIVWHFGHGLHNRRRFSGRYEVILWYTRTDKYVFKLDDVRVPSKYPGKRHHRGPKAGELSANPLGKNPSDIWQDIDCSVRDDVWDIPNVKNNHIEKTIHPCQFPIGLVERVVRALTNPGALILDPFAGVGSTGAAAALLHRRFWGAEISQQYVDVARARIESALRGELRFRPHDQPLYDHTRSKLSQRPDV